MGNRCGQTETTAHTAFLLFFFQLFLLNHFKIISRFTYSLYELGLLTSLLHMTQLLSVAFSSSVSPHLGLRWTGWPPLSQNSVPLPSAQNGDFLSSPYRSPFVIKSFLWVHLPAVNQYANAIQERTQGLASRAELCTTRAQKLFISNKPKRKRKKNPPRCCAPQVQLALPGFLISTSQHSGTCLVSFARPLRERRSSQEQGPISIKLDHSPSEKTCQINATGHSIQDCRFESGKKMHLGKLDG